MADAPRRGRVAAEPICPLCAKPVTSGSLVVFQQGELFHVRCLSRAGQGDAPAAPAGPARKARRPPTPAVTRAHPRLVIVRRDRSDLLPVLRERFGPDVPVILDRRKGERRAGQSPIPVERRSGLDRRRPPTEAGERQWREMGYCIVDPPEG
jgi:hypothetical protein